MIFQTPNLPGFENFPLGEIVEQQTKIPVFLDNDAKCAAFGEKIFGSAKTVSDFILLTFGTGIGGGVFANNQMIYGKSDGACELGHMTLYPNGHPCKCGNLGCFEQYASATAIGRRATEALGADCGVKKLMQAQESGEAWATKALKGLSKDLALGLSSLVNIFEPELIILGGGVFSQGGGPLIPWVQEDMQGRCFASSLKNLRIESAQLKGDSGVLGAAAMAFSRHSP